jgi:DNA-nicking Smr family endonuclease
LTVARRQDDRQRFAHSPFKPLKGLTVSGGAPPPVSPVPPAPPPEDAGDLFTREMEWLAVRRFPGGEETATGDVETAPVAPPASPEDTSLSEFLEAVGKLDKSFADELPADAVTRRPRPRRMKQLERGTLKPAGDLDLHGLNRDEALARTRAFLAHASRQGWPAVLIVTGKGLHSREGPVLRRAVEHLLAENPELVLEWGPAPRRYGGGGALAVFVRPAPHPA